MHTHCKGFLLHKFKDNKAKYSLGHPLLFSITEVGESSSGLHSSVEMPEIWISLPAPGWGCPKEDA